MKKSILLFLISTIVSVLLFNTACGTPEISFTWYALEGSGSYSEDDNTSSIYLNGVVVIEQPNVLKNSLNAEITNWAYYIKEGDNFILSIFQNDSSSVLGTSQKKSGREYGYLWINIASTLPAPGDMYRGYNPDTFTLYLEIRDDNGTLYEIKETSDFNFTRD